MKKWRSAVFKEKGTVTAVKALAIVATVIVVAPQVVAVMAAVMAVMAARAAVAILPPLAIVLDVGRQVINQEESFLVL